MPHLDHPSLAFYAPAHFDSFITVMLAIDDMTEGFEKLLFLSCWVVCLSDD